MSNIVAFSFEGLEIRTLYKNDDPWFVAMDVCNALGLSNPHKAIKSLDDDEKDDLTLSDSIDRQQAMNIINESGLYILILRSRNAVKPGTLQHRFRKWVTSEVLPSIRKTGQYDGSSETKAQSRPRELSLAAREAELNARENALRDQEIEIWKAWHRINTATVDQLNNIIQKENEVTDLRRTTIRGLITHSTLSNEEICNLVNDFDFECHGTPECAPEIVAYHRRKIAEEAEEDRKASTSH